MKNFAGWAFTGKNKKKAFLLEKISSEGNIYPPFIERILKRRGIKKENYHSFLNPEPYDLMAYHHWESLKNAIDLISWAVKNKKKIHLHSDYDADGITSLTMLCASIRKLGGKFSYSLSNRFKGGYGISQDIFEDSFQKGCELFISLDCGTSSYDIHQRAKKNKVPLLIIDHHPVLEKIDNWVSLCNTHLSDCPENFKNFSSAGIVFKIVEGLYEKFSLKFPFSSYSRLACLGLSQDIVEMLGENHSIVSIGMKEIPRTNNLFLRELLKVSGLENKILNSNHLYYRLGPRLNAPGRMDDATFIIDLFLNPEERKVQEGIQKIEKFNKLRQEVQEKVFREALKEFQGEEIILAYNPEWHLGVLGLVASKLAQEKGKIAFCLSKDKDTIKGSGRSIPEISLIEILEKSKSFLEGFGGHSMACGISLKENKLRDFVENLKEISKNIEYNEPILEIEEEIDFKDFIEGFQFLSKMEPFGNKNPKPLFLTQNAILKEEPRKINNYYFLNFQQKNETLSGIGFDLENFKFPREFSMLYYPAPYGEKISLQFYGILNQ